MIIYLHSGGWSTKWSGDRELNKIDEIRDIFQGEEIVSLRYPLVEEGDFAVGPLLTGWWIRLRPTTPKRLL